MCTGRNTEGGGPRGGNKAGKVPHKAEFITLAKILGEDAKNTARLNPGCLEKNNGPW